MWKENQKPKKLFDVCREMGAYPRLRPRLFPEYDIATRPSVIVPSLILAI